MKTDNDATVPEYQWAHVPRSFACVKQLVGELGRSWFEDAVQATVEESQGLDSGPVEEPTPNVRVLIGRPYVGQAFFALPMGWTVTGTVLPPVLIGKLEIIPTGPADVRVGVRMLPKAPPPSFGSDDRALDESLDEMAAAFLRRVCGELEQRNSTLGSEPPRAILP